MTRAAAAGRRYGQSRDDFRFRWTGNERHVRVVLSVRHQRSRGPERRVAGQHQVSDQIRSTR